MHLIIMPVSIEFAMRLAAVYTFICFWSKVHGQCGECNEFHFSCYNEQLYQRCVYGVPNGIPSQCPIGTFCSTFDSNSPVSPCVSDPVAIPDCRDECTGVCDIDTIFKCTGSNTYRICSDGATLQDATCPVGMVCTLTSPCKELSVVNMPLCPISVIQTTPAPTRPPSTPNQFCQALGRHQGRYPPLTTNPDCKEYYYCYLYNGQMRGQQYTCPGRTVFDCRTRSCIVPGVVFNDCSLANPLCAG